MKRWVVTFAYAAVGLGFTVSSVVLANWLQIVPHFPAFGGEDDFTLRADAYFMVVCPAFIVLGGVIGYVSQSQWRRGGRAWLGVIAGTMLVFALVRAFAPWVEAIHSSAVANLSAVGFLVAWPVFAACGAALAAGDRTRLARSRGRAT